ncbi:unnamed protein product [Mytilus coruscus]|uniref:C3H1-type domain-containing protein n=1 Tax=Mytilus coruscus TaxID=42192 RepID=A0A6J8E627_MYTCO|nr:unnamed protein product [Mytilus coruscus]
MRAWDVIDGQLWLQFIAVGINHVQQTSSYTSHTVNKPCYDYNIKGVCTSMNCVYSHSYRGCSQFHPLMYCTNYSYNKNNPRSSVTSHYSAPRYQNYPRAPVTHNSAPRYQSSAGATTQSNRFLNPHRNFNQNTRFSINNYRFPGHQANVPRMQF